MNSHVDAVKYSSIFNGMGEMLLRNHQLSHESFEYKYPRNSSKTNNREGKKKVSTENVARSRRNDSKNLPVLLKDQEI